MAYLLQGMFPQGRMQHSTAVWPPPHSKRSALNSCLHGKFERFRLNCSTSDQVSLFDIKVIFKVSRIQLFKVCFALSCSKYWQQAKGQIRKSLHVVYREPFPLKSRNGTPKTVDVIRQQLSLSFVSATFCTNTAVSHQCSSVFLFSTGQRYRPLSSSLRCHRTSHSSPWDRLRVAILLAFILHIFFLLTVQCFAWCR